ncbi:uncharacterized protein BDZ99DRAFT_181141 [Mytilinidion resinicola]|uniref:Uncharacterized protein n=1 Tax=Mytilinidion resinicola TaxID=574789 RepID=A0A6A6Z1F1_9PEZI|nr:uncharacterized protein BDZ99DRAFT_181141 [Mytilinidion resinicola]KAF2814628.1 hypothetical protein BDZ99DRAFT_181141 [Mytilinidion resinicola]
MASCLATYGLPGWKYQVTKIAHVFVLPWTLCASAAVLGGSCLDKNLQATHSEPGEMFIYQRNHGLVDPQDSSCTEITCSTTGSDPRINAHCDNLGCGDCFRHPGGGIYCTD